MALDEQTYRCYAEVGVMAGDVCEVGLGAGSIVTLSMEKSRVLSYTNYERDADVVARYEAAYPSRDPKHTIYSEDFLTAPSRIDRFDVGLIDVFDEITIASYANAKSIINRLEGIMKPGGRIMVEFQSAVPVEYEFRQFMIGKFGRMKTEFYNSGSPADSRHVGYFEVP